YPEVGLEAGVIAMLQGREAAAEASWRSVVEIEPDSEAATTARGYLAQLAEPAAQEAAPCTPFPSSISFPSAQEAAFLKRSPKRAALPLPPTPTGTNASGLPSITPPRELPAARCRWFSRTSAT